MSPNMRPLICLFILVMLNGCAETLKSDTIQPADVPAALPVGEPEKSDEEVLSRLSSLDPIQLNDGSCGLFLWSRIGGRRTLVSVIKNDEAYINIQIDGKPSRFPLTSTSGRAYYGIFEVSAFQTADLSGVLTLDNESVSGMPQGATVKRASLSLVDKEGFVLALPVAGLIACKQSDNS